MKKIGAKGVGKSFFVYKYGDIDISLPRVEKKVGFGHTGFDVSLATSEEIASKRRDFTMNALMFDIFSHRWLDFWGGFDDIKKKIIRVVDKKSFKEDSLRVLRAAQFSARLGFKIDSDSIKIMQDIDLGDLTKDRIFLEFEKLFSARYLEFGLYYLSKLLIFKKIFGPDLECSSFFKTAKELKKHQKNFEKDIYRYYFLYILSKLNGWDLYDMLDKINAKKEYKKFYKIQPKTTETDEKSILKVALKMPIKLWLENYNEEVKNRAKKLGVYDKKFKTPVTAQDVINSGYRKDAIGKEIGKREIKYIDKFLSRNF